MTFQEALEITDFSQSPILEEIINGEYDILTPSSSPTEDSSCPVHTTTPANPIISLSFAGTSESLPNDFTYMLWIGLGGKMWMQVFQPTSPNGNQVITHVIPHGLVDTDSLKSWVIGISHNADVEVHVTVCPYGFNQELGTNIPGEPNTIHTLEFSHVAPFGCGFDETTRYYTEEWCSARFHTQVTKTASPGFVNSSAAWWIGSTCGRVFDATYVQNTAPATTYSNYLELYPLMSSDKLGQSSLLDLTLYRSNTNNITEGFGQLTASGFSGTSSTDFNGAYLTVPDVYITSTCAFSE